ncbi:MAG: O-antigen ligase family protein [Chloroflexota bacterium]|nr:O-antigen ligase family protein [Chloroflexota bacterium]
MFNAQIGRSAGPRSFRFHPAWLLIPAGLAGAVMIGLFLGYFQSPRLALFLLAAAAGIIWIAAVVMRPEWALIFYTLFAVNLNSVDISFGGVRLSPDIVLMSLLLVGTLLRILIDRKPVGGLPISVPYLIFLAVPIVTLIWTPVKLESIKGIFRFVGYYALVWLIVDTIRTRVQVRRMVLALVVSALIPILIGFFQAATGGGQIIWAGAVFNRIYGLAGGPFTLAYYLVLIIPLLLVLFLAERGEDTDQLGDCSDVSWWFSRPLLFALMLAAVVALVLTFIRGAWIAMVASLLVLGLLEKKARFRQLLFSIPLVAGVALVAFAPLLNRVTQVSESDSTLFGRLDVWRFATEWITSNPLSLLGGLGMKAFENYYILQAGPASGGLYWRREKFLVGNRPHNEILGFMLDVGLIGTLAFIATLVVLVIVGFRVYRKAPDRMLRLLGLAFLISTVGMFVGAMGDNVFSQPTVAVYFWIMAGLVMAIDRYMLPEDQDPAPGSLTGDP